MNYGHEETRHLKAQGDIGGLASKPKRIEYETSGLAQQISVPERDKREIEIQMNRLAEAISMVQSVAHALSDRISPILSQSNEAKDPGRQDAPSVTKFGSLIGDMASDLEKVYAFLANTVNSVEL